MPDVIYGTGALAVGYAQVLVYRSQQRTPRRIPIVHTFLQLVVVDALRPPRLQGRPPVGRVSLLGERRHSRCRIDLQNLKSLVYHGRPQLRRFDVIVTTTAGRNVAGDGLTCLAIRLVKVDIGGAALFERPQCVLTRPTGLLPFLLALRGGFLSPVGSALGEPHAAER